MMGRDIRDENRLVFSILPHVHPSALCDGENMWRIFILPLIAVLLDHGVAVQWKVGVRIDRH